MIVRQLVAAFFLVAYIAGIVEPFAKEPSSKKHPAQNVYPPLEIKGVRLGMSVTELTTQVPYAGCRNGHCEIYTTIAGQPANLLAEVIDGKIDDVYLSKWKDGDVEDVRGFEAKYGAPQISTRVLQNSYGARLECPLYTWTLPDGILWIAKYRPDTRDLPQIEMESIERAKRDEIKHKKSESDI